ncbi:MAG: hypothetical protein PWP76_522 [Candidatus Diapherotrites archaeon]|nr:hypothetical protein [Candidatus Diapherotrites archaeon]MDN5367189.1 hypothetical protein [Candidatus Diapherotrites archaeon]
MKRLALFFLLLLPLALAETVPTLPAFYWGEVNASCALTTLAPNILARFEYNGTVLTSLSITDEGNNIYRFGGPSASDPKAVIDCSTYPDANIVLYVNDNAFYILGTEDCNAGEVKYLHFDMNSDECKSLFPAASYTVNVTLPSNCNGSLSSTTLGVYYGSTELVAPASLSGDKSTSKTFTVDGYAKNVPEGATITFKLCNGSNCDTETTSFNYGEDTNVSFSASCSALFPSSSTQEETALPPSETNATETTTTTTSDTTPEPKTTTEEKNVVSGPPELPVPADEQNKSVVENVLEQIDRGTRKILGMPPDVALIVAIVIVIVIILAIRFIL